MTRIFEVGDGTRTYGVFPTESKAKAHLKELKAKGTKARIYVSYDGPEAPRNETKPKKKPARKIEPSGKTEGTKRTPAKRPSAIGIDPGTCTVQELARLLYSLQQAMIADNRWYREPYDGTKYPVRTESEIESILCDPSRAPDVCDVYLTCYISNYSEYWGYWSTYGTSYDQWKALTKRLRSIKTDAGMTMDRAKRTSGKTGSNGKTRNVTSKTLSKQLSWDRVRTNGGFVEDAYIVGEKGVYRLVVDMVEMDDVYDWNASVHLGGRQVGSLSMRLGRKSEDSAKYRQLIEEKTVALFLGQDRFVKEATAGEYERWMISHRKDGDPGDGQPKKKVTKPKPRNAAAGKGQYSASYYEKLERELKRVEKEGDNDAIIAITREIAESLSAEGEEIPDARAYLDDSDYGELARNSRWKYDSRETNRRYLKKIRDEQAMYDNANRKKMGGRRR